MRYLIFWLRFLLLLPFLSINYNIQATHSLSASNSSKHLCHHKDGTALLHFIRDFAINSSASEKCLYYDQTSHPKIRSWKGNTDCCSWDGVSCDSLSGHVVKLDLSCGQILGTIDSNSSLFQLQQLQSLNLAFNWFYNSTISPKIGKFSHLRYLNLSSAGFSGIVPTEIANLSQLTSLDLSIDDYPYGWLKLPDLALITESMTGLTQLHLGYVSIVNSAVPPSLAKLTSLSSLVLQECGLQGNLPLAKILHFPHIRNLVIEGDNLHVDFSRISWTSPLEVLHLSSLNFTGKLPKSPGPTQFLRELYLYNSSFYGVIPRWVWNTTERIELSYNQFSGELPSLINTSQLSKIESIYLSSNKLSGKIPPWLFTLPSLSDLGLDYNQFSGELIVENLSPSRSSWNLDLSTKYKVHESNRTLTSGATNLQVLHLDSNKLNGTIDFSVFYKFPNLTSLFLSNTNLSLSFNDDTPTQPPQIHVLYLDSCNLGKFPNFLIDQDHLQMLHLSNSKIHGQVPQWFLEKESLTNLNLSHNYLTGGLENIPFSYNMAIIDLSYNMFRGLLPSTVCNSNLLEFLDLSKNSLTGHIPRCLGNFSDKLSVLNLRLNEFQGTIPPNFTKCGSLMVMDLNKNNFEGRVPSSLSSCLSLEVLDLGNNMLSGKFPLWLSNLTELKVLVLRSNWFKGPLSTKQGVESPFPKLRILDIANNRLSGNLPHKLINSLKGMMNKAKGRKEQYMSGYYTETLDHNRLMFQYMFSTELTIKGSDRNVDKVLSDLVVIDVSSNMFEGDIPTAIGDLVLLRWLNLSHNNFSGTIPSSLSNLAMLESLDISTNELVGQIPKELSSLTSLEFFNVSRNQLAGPIPTGNQFNTFESGWYLDNAGLCGIPLSKKCGTDGDAATEPPPTVYHDFADISIWEVVLMGYGCGMVFGLVIGCVVFLVRTPFWVLRLIYWTEFTMEHHFKRRWRRQLA